MAPFSPGANAHFRVGLAALTGLAIGVPLAPLAWRRAPEPGRRPEQPVPFDHRHHVRDRGIDCVYCHTTVETDAAAGMPTTERCIGCHRLLPDMSELEPITTSWRSTVPVRWRRVTALPAYVYFHHGVHVHAGVACDRCHGDVERSARLVPDRAMTMAFCLDCHRQAQGSRAVTHLTTCTACHR
jgi:hypothetical protein